ncbi:MAG: glycosyltransferase [Promethearchaeota archaeon]
MKRKLCVTQVVHNFPPVVGGIETYAYNLAKGLVDAGHLVRVYTSRTPGAPNQEVWQGIHIHRYRAVARPFSYPFMPGLFTALMRDDCDIIHAHINSPMTVDLTAMVSRLLNVPLAITYHADALLSDFVPKPASFHKWLGQIYWLARHFAAGVASRLIVTSPLYLETSEFLERYRGKTSVIPAVVDPFFLESLDKPLTVRKELGISSDSPFLLFVGRLVPYKGLRTLLRAFRLVHKRNPSTQLVLIGSGPEYPHLQRLSRELGVVDATRFLGKVSREFLRDVYSACDVFVLPSRSRSEAFGIVLLEAMARGKPVVATHVGGIPYVVNHGKTGFLVPPHDPVPLAKRISSLINDAELCSKIGKAAQERVMRKFTREPTTRQLESLYFEMIE